MTNIFISWSGNASREVANALRDWLPKVLAGKVTCFVSSQDIQRGDRGLSVIAGELDSGDFGIVVLTRENLKSPWVHFEAGALGKSLGGSKVAPLLLDVSRTDVTGPLSQFQSTLLGEVDDMRTFVKEIAAAESLPEASASALFESFWGELHAVVEATAGAHVSETQRSDSSMLEEILQLLRDQARESKDLEAISSAVRRLSASVNISKHEPDSLAAKLERRKEEEDSRSAQMLLEQSRKLDRQVRTPR